MKAMRMASLMVVAVVMVGFLAGRAWAAEPPAAEEVSWFQQYIGAGGWIGYVIVFCSFISVALSIEHAVNIKRDKIVPPQLIDEIEGMFENEEYQEALELCEAEPNFLTNVLAAGLPKINAGFDTMKAAMTEAAEIEAIRLSQKISLLALLANLAPMLGLFGTVSGMIGAFATIAAMGSAVTPADLATGVGQALVTTFLGLLVAIPTMVAFFLFRNRVVRVTIELTGIAHDLVERFRGK